MELENLTDSRNNITTLLRKWLLILAFVALLASVALIRAYRFEHHSEMPSLTLASLKNAYPNLPPGAEWVQGSEGIQLKISHQSNAPTVIFRAPLPNVPALQALHVRVHMVAHGLMRGQNEWDDGRLMVGWADPVTGTLQESDSVFCVRDNQNGASHSQVLRPNSGFSLPVLKFEHLGASGQVIFFDLEVTPVKERAFWKTGRWLVAAAWFMWLMFFLRVMGTRSKGRAVLATALWLALAAYFAFPGPWKSIRPCWIPFQLGQRVQVSDELTPSAVSPASTSLESGKATAPRIPQNADCNPSKDSWMVHLKQKLAAYRTLIHVLLLFFPSFLWLCLLGKKPGVILAAGFAGCIELAQFAMGFGFDWQDIGDLAFDALGVLLAYQLFQWGMRKRDVLRSLWHLRPSA